MDSGMDETLGELVRLSDRLEELAVQQPECAPYFHEINERLCFLLGRLAFLMPEQEQEP